MENAEDRPSLALGKVSNFEMEIRPQESWNMANFPRTTIRFRVGSMKIETRGEDGTILTRFGPCDVQVFPLGEGRMEKMGAHAKD